MINSKNLSAAIALAVGTMIALPGIASAAKRLTYEQAWEQCKKEFDSAEVVGANADVKARSTIGGGSVRKHGYLLKK